MRTREQIKATIIDIIKVKFPYVNTEELLENEDVDLMDELRTNGLCLDELDAVELIMECEKEFDILIDDVKLGFEDQSKDFYVNKLFFNRLIDVCVTK